MPFRLPVRKVCAKNTLRHPVVLAAVVSILSAFTSPITQQAVELDTRMTGDFGKSKVNTTHHWYGFGEGLEEGNREYGRMEQASASGLISLDTHGHCSHPVRRQTAPFLHTDHLHYASR
jgi:hypothetical protein